MSDSSTREARDPFSFDDQVVIVTGSSSGIGEACARRLAERGARVVVNSRSSVEAGEALAREIGDAACYLQADVAIEHDCKRLIAETVERLGRLDHVINNAGTTHVIPHHDFDALTDDVWQSILTTNLMGTFYMSRAALPHLKKTRGSIVNVTSIAGLRQTGSSVPYSVSKAAINQLTRLMANQVGPEIRINAVAPGLIATPWTADWTEIHERVAATAPLKRSGTPDDIATACIALMACPYTTGEVLAADGGVILRS